MKTFHCLMMSLCLLTCAKAQDDLFSRPIVVPTPGPSEFNVRANVVYRETEEARLLADIYTPISAKSVLPGVIFIHGGPVPEDPSTSLKDSGAFRSYGALATDAGLAGVVFNHRLHSIDHFRTANADVQAAVSFVRTNGERYGIDRNRLCVWIFSGGGAFVTPFLSEQPEWLKCIVLYYAVLEPSFWKDIGLNGAGEQLADFNPLSALEAKSAWDPALFVAEAGEDNATLNRGLRAFLGTALENGWRVEYWNHPTGPHAFDILKDDQRSKDIIGRTMDFLRLSLSR
jgi:acetyl esterase/lipase